MIRNFKVIDKDGSGTLSKEEFKRALDLFRAELKPVEADALFDFYDKDGGGQISQDEFLRGLRGRLSGMRKEIVDKVFKILDADGSGEITFEDLKDKYDTSGHPKVRKGEWKHEDAIKEFLGSFEGEGGNGDGIVTKQEFDDYYAGVSGSIDDDDFFGVMMDQSWGFGFIPERDVQNIVKTMRERAMQKAGNSAPKTAVKKTFAFFDTNRSKSVDLHEFKSAMEALVPGLTEKDKTLLFKRFDDDDSGEISYDEFIAFVFPDSK